MYNKFEETGLKGAVWYALRPTTEFGDGNDISYSLYYNKVYQNRLKFKMWKKTLRKVGAEYWVDSRV